MLARPARWRRGLIASWIAYWVLLALWAIGPAIPIIWRVTRPGRHGTMSASFGGEGLTFTVSEGASSVWTGTVALGELALWVVVPPLLLLLLWMALARRARSTAPDRERV